GAARPQASGTTAPGARRVLVTGAGGKTGRAVLRALVARGVEVRGLVRSERAAAHVAEIAGTSDAAVSGDQRDPEDLARVLTGCDAVYAIAPNMSPYEREMAEALLRAMRVRGVVRLAYHSVVDPDEPAMPHHADKAEVERLLAAAGDLACTVLRPNAYAQNLAGTLAGMRTGTFEVPYATDAVSAFVDLADVAQVAADVLADGSHVGAHLELSGPHLVSSDDVAAMAAALLGHAVVARLLDPDAWAAANPGFDAETRRRLTAMFRHYDRFGSPGDPTTLRRLLGREPGRPRDVLARLLAG
ncbi:MAG: NmrA family NAD(P)-binding protein, partial [Nitriliruptoraceae bacterium]|nr:NmrA family NAD(P)-binding protein [Nitriliruptoraceae bacterium]